MYNSPTRNARMLNEAYRKGYQQALNEVGNMMQGGDKTSLSRSGPQAFAKAPNIDPPKTPCPPGQSWQMVITIKDGVVYYHHECR